MTEIVIDYNSDLEHLLKIHAEECESLSILHRQSFEKYNKQSNYIKQCSKEEEDHLVRIPRQAEI